MWMQALWKQRRRELRQARAAQTQSGRQPDLISECTGAQSMSTSRRQDSGKLQQNGALGRREQEAQSARVSAASLLCTCITWLQALPITIKSALLSAAVC